MNLQKQNSISGNKLQQQTLLARSQYTSSISKIQGLFGKYCTHFNNALPRTKNNLLTTSASSKGVHLKPQERTYEHVQEALLIQIVEKQFRHSRTSNTEKGLIALLRYIHTYKHATSVAHDKNQASWQHKRPHKTFLKEELVT